MRTEKTFQNNLRELFIEAERCMEARKISISEAKNVYIKTLPWAAMNDIMFSTLWITKKRINSRENQRF